jgi:hypothetical protein
VTSFERTSTSPTPTATNAKTVSQYQGTLCIATVLTILSEIDTREVLGIVLLCFRNGTIDYLRFLKEGGNAKTDSICLYRSERDNYQVGLGLGLRDYKKGRRKTT